MLLKKILPVFAIAGIATAAPVEDLEARATGGNCGSYSNAWCCATAFPFSVFFIQQVGSNCGKPSKESLNDMEEDLLIDYHRSK